MSNYRCPLIIMKKELMSYFTTPIAYIVITIFLLFTGFFFFKDFFYYNQAEMRSFFQLLPLFFCFVVPAATMRLFSEERHSGTLEILMTLPVSTFDAVAGKIMAGTVFTAAMLAPTLIYIITVIVAGSPDPGPLIGGYFGSLLLGAACSSIGVLCSSFSKNQIIAFILSWAVCFILWLIDKIIIFVPVKLGFVEYLGSDFHFQNVAKGIIDSRDIVYFASIIAVCLLFSMKFVEERK